MAFAELIAGVEDHEKTLTVYDEGAAGEVRERFADRNVVVEAGRAEGDPERFAVLSRDGEFLAAVGIDDLLEEPAMRRPGFDANPYRPILDELDETMFTSYDDRQMLAASREIEDRAWRVGRGTLHAGFQRVSTFLPQFGPYTALGERGSLTAHVYASPDRSVPPQDAFVVHLEESEEIERFWFLAYDGGGLDENKCALLAEEREPNSFYGFWTYDPDTVDYMIDHLSSTYLPVDADRGLDRRPSG